jgi:putative membrane protein insertion efficiency factor
MKSAATAILQLYKGLVSPLFPPACRYVPTCSEYAAEAVARHGFWHGTALAVWRVLRCNPFARGGYDPVQKS